jgi:hypothetical protein
MIPIPQSEWFAQWDNGLLNGSLGCCAIGRSLARSSAPGHAIAARLACGVCFFSCRYWLAAGAVTASCGRRFAIAATPNSCGGLGRVQRCNVVAELGELGSKCSLDLLGIRGGELVLERENSVRPDC